MLKNISLKKTSKKAILAAIFYIVVKWTLVLTLGAYLYKAEWFKKEYFAVFPIFVLTALFIYYRKTGKLPFRKNG